MKKMIKILVFNHPLIGKSVVKLLFFVVIKDIFIHQTFSRDTWPVGPENSAWSKDWEANKASVRKLEKSSDRSEMCI